MATYDYRGGQEAEKLLREIFRITGHPQAEVARYLGCTGATLSDKMRRGTLRAGLFLDMVSYCGVEIKFYDKATGKEIKPERSQNDGSSERVIRTADKITYDTAYSIALSDTFYEDGEHKYNADGVAQKLYVKDGRYFIVVYKENGEKADVIDKVSAEQAAEFIQLHGTDLH